MPTPNPTPGTGGSTAPEEIDLAFVIEVVRRHWLLFTTATALALAGGAGWVLTRPDTYSTSALVRMMERSSPLSSFAVEMSGQGLPADAMASEVELLNSEAVLGPVVLQLSLNLDFPGHPDLRLPLLNGATTDARVVPGEYTLEGAGDQLLLLDESGATLASAPGGQVLVGPGFRIPVPDVPTLGGSLPLRVTSVPGAMDELRRSLNVSQAQNTSLIRIRFTARDPEFAAAVVNAVVQSYYNRAASVARDAATRRREFLARQLAAVADSVRDAQSALARFQEESRLLDPASEGESLAAGLRQQEAAVRDLQYQQGLLRSLVAGLTESGDGGGLERIVTLSEEMVPGAQTVYARLRSLQDERSRMTADRIGYRETSSRVAVLDSLIQGARDELRSLAQESLNLTGARLTEARREAATLRSEVGSLPAQATAMTQLEQNAEAVLSTFGLLSERYYEAQIAEAVASADVEIVDYARAPLSPDRRNRTRPILLATLLGLLTGGIGALSREGLNKTVRRSGDAEAAAGLPLLGMIPLLPAPRRFGRGKVPLAPLVVRAGEHGGPAAEAFKALPAMIRYARVDGTKVVAVVSQGPQEGKSFTAANLALALARQGNSTLLIDCDLHRPKLHRMLDGEKEPGVTNFLTHQAPWDACVQTTTEPSLWLMAAGTRVPDPANLLGSPRFEALLASARREFDMVVVDTPPVLAVSEVLEMARHFDGMVMVARAERTNRFALQEAASRLRKVDAPLLGLVLNGVEAGNGDGAYGGYYYRYYTYDYSSKD